MRALQHKSRTQVARTSDRNWEEGKPRSRFFLLKGLAFIATAITIWLVINARNIKEYIETYEKRSGEAEEITKLEQRIRILEKQQNSLKQNGFETEVQIRERIGMHYPGEKVIFLKPDERGTSATATPAPSPSAAAAATLATKTKSKTKTK